MKAIVGCLRAESRMPLWLGLMFWMPLAVPAQSEVYKWVDGQGHVHFEDRLQAHTQVEIVNLPALPPVSTENRAKTKVVMYATEWCPYCEKARQFFKRKHIPFTEYDVEKQTSRMQEFEKLGGNGYPLILIGKQKLYGFNESDFEAIWSAVEQTD